MDKIEKLLEMQKLLDSISSKMDELKEDLNRITKCVQEKRLISVDVSGRVMSGLLEVNDLNEECKKLYAEAGIDKEMSDKIEMIEKDIAQAISDIELDNQLAKYKRFLHLETSDEDTKILLDAKKVDMQSILSDYTVDREKELEPYAKFIELIQETDNTKAVTLMLELSQVFGNALLAKAIMEKTITVGNVVDSKESEYNSLNPKEKNLKNNAEKNTSDIGTKAESSKINENEQAIVKTEEVFIQDNTIEENINQVEENTEPAKIEENVVEKKIKEKGLLITEDVFNKPFFSHISDAESNKVGSKIFKNEINMLNTSANAVVLVNTDQLNSATAEILSITSGASLNKIELAIDHLYRKGYIREYGISGLGSFYCTSPRFVKAMQSKEAKSFLKIKGVVKSTEGEQVEETVSPVLSRIGYTKLYTKYLKQFGKDSQILTDIVWSETFACRVSTKEKDKAYVFVGAFFTDGKEAELFVKFIQENIFNVLENRHYVVAGINFDYANKLAEYPDLRSEMAASAEEYADEIYNILLAGGCIYHTPNRILPSFEKRISLKNIELQRGAAIGEKIFVSGIGTYLIKSGRQSIEDVFDMFQIPMINLAEYGNKLVRNAKWRAFETSIHME